MSEFVCDARRSRRAGEARHWLSRGRDFFAESAAKYVPRTDPGVAERFNRKAVELHDRYVASAERLAEEMARLDREHALLERSEAPDDGLR